MSYSRFFSDVSSSGSGSATPDSYAKIIDKKPEGTAGGGITSGAYRTRDLTDIDVDDDGIILSLSSNQFQLAAGTYKMSAITQAFAIGNTKARLQNVTDGETVIFGNGASQSNFGITVFCFLKGQFTIDSTKTFEIQMRSTISRGTDGLGNDLSLGHEEIYTEVEIWKENS